MSNPVVLVLGGYGVFGSRIVKSLAQHPELGLIVAGRNLAAATAFASTIVSGNCRPMAVDASYPGDLASVVAMRPTIVVDTVGPFQGRDTEFVRRCAESGIHYVDIADARSRVAGIASLDAIARANDAAVISGASTVPAITTAFVDDLAPAGSQVVGIDVGISPGHRAPRGLATVRSIFSYSGKRIPPVVGDGTEFGWGGLTRYGYPSPVGSRWLSNVDTPERALWRTRYPTLRKAAIRAGFEIGFLHLTLSALSFAVRLRLLSSLEPCAGLALRVADAFDRWGADTGAMHVRVITRDAAGKTATRTAMLVAEKGDGPQIPATPAALVVKKLLELPGYAPLTVRGAYPCIGLMTRAEIMNELRGFAIRYFIKD
jgi:hypothetical protein